MIIEQRWYQDAADNALWNYFHTKPPVIEKVIQQRNPIVAMPTGTGKSVSIARFNTRALKTHPYTRVLVATHVKELLKQNSDKQREYWPEAPLGLFSSGLNKREVAPITFGGIKTIINHVDKLGKIDIMHIDEAHLLSPKEDGTYKDLINRLRVLNPYMPVIGWTATPYRLGIGSLTNNGIFTDTAIDLTSLENFNRLVNDGYLCPLVTRRRGNIVVPLAEVGVSNGEYKQKELQKAADNTDLINAIVLDILNNVYGTGRLSALIFATGVKHAEHISQCFAHYGVEVPAVHSDMESARRDEILREFKAGRYWGLVNNNILTTGFDHPPIDFIACIRSTMSTGLWVQMLGRGTRPFYTKSNCLVHDYAGNTERLGPINDPVIPRMKGAGGGGEAPVWCCPACGTYNHARAPFCVSCGMQHDMAVNHTSEASTLEVMVSEQPIIEMFEVDRVYYYRHVSRANPLAPPLLRVRYACGYQTFDEYLAFEHEGPRRAIAERWWRQRFTRNVPSTVDEAIIILNDIPFHDKPARINVHTNLKFPRIIGVEF